MSELKEQLYNAVLASLVGLNALFHYLGVENIKSTILWIFTIILIVFKINAEYLKRKENQKLAKLDLELKKEQIKLVKQENFNKERENFKEFWNSQINDEKE